MRSFRIEENAIIKKIWRVDNNMLAKRTKYIFIYIYKDYFIEDIDNLKNYYKNIPILIILKFKKFIIIKLNTFLFILDIKVLL